MNDNTNLHTPEAQQKARATFKKTIAPIFRLNQLSKQKASTEKIIQKYREKLKEIEKEAHDILSNMGFDNKPKKNGNFSVDYTRIYGTVTKEVIEYLTNNGPTRTQEIANNLKKHYSSVYSILRKLEANNIVVLDNNSWMIKNVLPTNDTLISNVEIH